MGLAFYIYTILILLISAASGMISLSAFFVSRKRAFLFAVSFFFFYFLDVALIFQFEYAQQNVDFSLADFYVIDYPVMKILIGLGALESMFLIICDYVDEHRLAVKIIPAVLFVVLSMVVVLLVPEGKWHQWLFYTVRQLFMLWCIGFVVYRYFRTDNQFYRLRMRRYKTLFLVVLGFVVAIVTEDILMILVWEPTLDSSILMLYLSQRNFCENFMMILFAAYTMRSSADMLKLRFHEPPTPTNNSVAQYHIDNFLPMYCARHNLTERERQILLLVLNEKDTQNIASELHLATGTVKAHVHNILHKTGHETRRDLVKDFWKQ